MIVSWPEVTSVLALFIKFNIKIKEKEKKNMDFVKEEWKKIFQKFNWILIKDWHENYFEQGFVFKKEKSRKSPTIKMQLFGDKISFKYYDPQEKRKGLKYGTVISFEISRVNGDANLTVYRCKRIKTSSEELMEALRQDKLVELYFSKKFGAKVTRADYCSDRITLTFEPDIAIFYSVHKPLKNCMKTRIIKSGENFYYFYKILNSSNESKISLKSEKNGFEYFEDSHLKFQDNKKTVQKISEKDFERKTGNKKIYFS